VGQKVHPIGMRLGIVRTWRSRWFGGNDFSQLLAEDQKIRAYIRLRLPKASISEIEIERAPKRVQITIHTARPGIVIGRKGTEVDRLRDELKHLTGKDIFINILEIKRPELDADLVAQNIQRQLEGRVMFRRAMKKAVENTMRMGAEGIRIECSGRLGGSEMSRSERQNEGRVPLHTLRADIDYSKRTAITSHGTIGVKVWICRGEVIDREVSAPGSRPASGSDDR
jgi:small subunit ribosomal protein S3